VFQGDRPDVRQSFTTYLREIEGKNGLQLGFDAGAQQGQGKIRRNAAKAIPDLITFIVNVCPMPKRRDSNNRWNAMVVELEKTNNLSGLVRRQTGSFSTFVEGLDLILMGVEVDLW
jgi:hypothetical protein